MRKRRIKVLLWIMILILVDQLSKVIIYQYFFDTNFTIIPHLLEFYPKFNLGYYYNDLLKLNAPPYLFIIFNIIVQFVMVFLFIRNRNQSKLFDWMFIFCEAGYNCSLITEIAWTKGCLDFIYLRPLFIFDFKDIYVSIFSALIIIYSITKSIKKVKIYKNNYHQRDTKPVPA